MSTNCKIVKLDSLGRLNVPAEFRHALNLNAKDDIEINTDGDKVILTKWQPHCTFCDETQKLVGYKGNLICGRCRKNVAES